MALNADSIREYMKDIPELNLLHDGMEQFDDDIVEIAIKLGKQDVEIHAPAVAFSARGIPDSIMYHAVIARLLESEAFLELRNQLQYQDNNMSSVPMSAKQQNYTQMSMAIKATYQEALDKMAMASFYQSAWGTSWSNSFEVDITYSMSLYLRAL